MVRYLNRIYVFKLVHRHFFTLVWGGINVRQKVIENLLYANPVGGAGTARRRQSQRPGRNHTDHVFLIIEIKLSENHYIILFFFSMLKNVHNKR